MNDTINLSKLANVLQAWKACKAKGNEWADKHDETIEELLKPLPHGSGIDAGVKLLREGSTEDKLLFKVDFHHMDEQGGYDGWTEHILTVRPSFIYGFTISISGRNRNEIKDYLTDLFNNIFVVGEG